MNSRKQDSSSIRSKATIGFCLFLAGFLLVATAAAPAERFYRVHTDFANAHNDWVSAIKDLSPSSPDYEDRLREEWLKREVSEKFRKLERSFER